MATDPFGFSTANRAAQEIARVEPEPAAPAPEGSLAALDRAARQHGFASREPEEKILRRRRDVGPTAQLNVKCPIPVYNRFIRFCDAERLPYWEGIEKLLDLAGVSNAGERNGRG